ncbi:aspartate aminotransferase family protein [Thermosulfuriphilus ammonigenes]|uniref:Acetylornithine aminotransferase n=1 Tax=Thermosulfuriphilus ammonigenes TaxID=1936021 RepID=A0A6G7PW71_9BACT|nr:aspartate aminotransferase family protein [Thermosulfuriphilus ammonigenes]MBA2848162.1 putative acetylornithine/succinylornithine family transaminase [Thermosulfuriphilus ammonigenes]QIJ71663.1 aspartate aminotransferase family protein [Thermosulfuriphilus ammonigenes]
MGIIVDRGEIYVARTYQRFPVAFVRGQGSRLWDEEGREYLDFVSGIAVCALGHCPEVVVEAIKDQAQRLLHTSNLYWTAPQTEVAQILCENSFADRVFFVNSGAEAVEAAFKCARRYSYQKYGPGRHEIIALWHSFHGRTMGALSLTGQRKYWEGFEPLVPGVKHVPPEDISALTEAIGPATCAVILEPIQGEGGVRPLSADYLLEVRRLCDEHDLVLIFDEIQVGLGRTGHLFAYQGLGIEPDLLTLAKALGGGLPIGALLGRERVMSALVPGSHASTFGGNPVACAAAKAVLETLLGPDFLDEVRLKGAQLAKALERLRRDFPELVLDVRGRGLIWGLELSFPAKELADRLFERRILTVPAGEKVLRFLPPLTVAYREIDAVVAAVKEVLGERGS